MLSLLAISFTPTEAPAGTVMLHFADDGAVRLDVECLEAALSDIGPRWMCNNPPEREGVPKMAQRGLIPSDALVDWQAILLQQEQQYHSRCLG